MLARLADSVGMVAWFFVLVGISLIAYRSGRDRPRGRVERCAGGGFTPLVTLPSPPLSYSCSLHPSTTLLTLSTLLLPRAKTHRDLLAWVAEESTPLRSRSAESRSHHEVANNKKPILDTDASAAAEERGRGGSLLQRIV
jgi:hypothetical protein